MIRSTTGGVLRSYRSNLMNSFIGLNKARETVLTQRTFNSYAEDPVSAAKAFQLRRARMNVDSQYSICDDALRKYQTGWSALSSVDELIDTENGTQINNLKGLSLRALNDPTGDARETLSKAISQISETIIQCMNSKYGESFVFAGADGKNVPFEVRDDGLYYRGVPVDSAVPDVTMDDSGAPLEVDLATGQISAGSGTYLDAKSVSVMQADEYDDIQINDPTAVPPNILLKADGTAQRVNENGELDDNGDYYLVIDNAETISKEDYDTAVENVAKLDYLANEKYFVDIGLGYKENENGELIESSAFNAALNGIHFVGYGVDEDGDPKNIYSLAQKMSEITSRVGDGNWSDSDWEELKRLVGKLEDASSKFKTEFVDMSAECTKLKNNESLLEDNFYTLVEQYSALEDVDMADAVTSFIWAQYCYNAALKVGNSILSESLMDYLS